MRTEVLEALKNIIANMVSSPVVSGSLLPGESFSVSAAGGAAGATFWTLNTDEDLPVAFNGKGANQLALANQMEQVHRVLTTSKNLPSGENWQIYAITTTSAPTLIGREENENWIFGSSFRVKFFSKGANVNGD